MDRWIDRWINGWIYGQTDRFKIYNCVDSVNSYSCHSNSHLYLRAN